METLQQIFDKSVQGIISQGGYAVITEGDNEDFGDFGDCTYFDEQTKFKCALGQLAKDDKQAKDWQERFLSRYQILVEIGLYQLEGIVNLVSALQDTHDDCAAEELPILDFVERVNKEAISLDIVPYVLN